MINTEQFADYKKRILSACGQVIVGKDEMIEKVLTAYLCGGHVLLEDLPGTGKTMLLRAFSAAVGGEFRRIQFTPDLLPSDLTGIHFYNQKTGEFEFRCGPLFGNVILADEINRATPRTQSSLLEVMEEHQITVDGRTFLMDPPFFVMATQNPLESQGTFPLPEAQIDRFFMRLSLGYMTRAQEIGVLMRRPTTEILKDLTQVVSWEETQELAEMSRQVEVTPAVVGYLMDIIELTRKNPQTGVSTRGAQALYRASQVWAALSGRSYVIPEDVKAMAIPVLAHRVGGGIGRREEEERYVSRLLEEVKVPIDRG